jgi:hypothetical protein
MSERVLRINPQCLLEAGFRILHATILVKQLSFATPSFGIGGVLGDDIIHNPHRHVMLPGLLLPEGLIDLHVNRLAAPLKFLTAAAGTKRIGIQNHSISFLLGGE